MSAFVGRSTELAHLSEQLRAVSEGRRGGFLALRGRRRVGKSRLVEEFARASGAPYVFFVATRQSPERELVRFEAAVAGSSLPSADLVRAGTSFASWEAAIGVAAVGATWDNPAIVVLDEFPYLAERDPAIEAVVQKVWDRDLLRAPVLLVAIGSDVATMEAMGAYGRPLYDRPREMVVRPLTPADVAEMLALDPVDALDAYLVIGGFPELAVAWGAGRGMWDYLEQAFGEANSTLVVGAQRALAAEFPDDAHARAVLAAVGSGDRAFGIIQARAGLPKTTLDRALGVLASKGVAVRSTPYSSKASTSSPRWTVADPYLRFWLRFVEPSIELLERDRGSLALDGLRASWASYRGRAVEPLVRASVERLLPDERFGGGARFVGGYWTRDNRVEVDLVGGDRPAAPARLGFVGSVKWRSDGPFDRDDLAALGGARKLVPGADASTRLVGVSRSGYGTDGLDVALDADDVLGAWRQ